MSCPTENMPKTEGLPGSSTKEVCKVKNCSDKGSTYCGPHRDMWAAWKLKLNDSCSESGESAAESAGPGPEDFMQLMADDGELLFEGPVPRYEFDEDGEFKNDKSQKIKASPAPVSSKPSKSKTKAVKPSKK